ncbi:MAG: class II fumarate hydratase [Candidatus Marinimicrobia bacterium]|nr:class II fumarate hydratase [Candidatus Neomarinimicrobiota bacterium]
MKTRIEKDSMGEMRVPENSYYGAQTQRAVENFPISGIGFSRRFIQALGMLKRAAAKVNGELGLLDADRKKAIVKAATEVVDGKFDDQFVIDIFQTGSGTSTNMNANEVIGNRASELMGGALGSREPVHPNDHVNMCQSSNDVIPSAIHLAAYTAIYEDLIPALEQLEKSFAIKAKKFDKILKIGRTHLQDATPVRLGQEFGGYASQVSHAINRIKNASNDLLELAIGGTAVGTGINAHPDFGRKVAMKISLDTGAKFIEAKNHFEAQGSKDAVVNISGVLKSTAVGISKAANDIRLMGAGPRTSIGEINLPAVAPGSSIMPGKVNPVMVEMVMQVTAQIIGNDATITNAGQGGLLELNVMMPVMAHNLLQSVELLSTASATFATRCVDGIEVNKERAAELVEQSLANATPLAPLIGYDKAAKISKEAFKKGKTIRQILKSKKILSDDKINKVLNLMKLTKPGISKR